MCLRGTLFRHSCSRVCVSTQPNRQTDRQTDTHTHLLLPVHPHDFAGGLPAEAQLFHQAIVHARVQSLWRQSRPVCVEIIPKAAQEVEQRRALVNVCHGGSHARWNRRSKRVRASRRVKKGERSREREKEVPQSDCGKRDKPMCACEWLILLSAANTTASQIPASTFVNTS